VRAITRYDAVCCANIIYIRSLPEMTLET
jgi:hypothetical protein